MRFFSHLGTLRDDIRIGLRKRRLSLDKPLSPEQFKADIATDRLPLLVMESGQTREITIHVRNDGPVVLNSFGRSPVFAGYRWIARDHATLTSPVTDAPLPEPIRPGQVVSIPVPVTAPDFVGDIRAQFFLRQTAVPPLENGGARPAIDAQIQPRSAFDIDYYKIYENPITDENYWTFVGPATREEYDRHIEARGAFLRSRFTPDVRVLDIGCGTGLLAHVCEDFLSEKGRYFGCDIGAEAIAFCRKKFRRPNFEFAQNAMTSVPLDHGAFDLVSFHSVFTHTFPDESVLLLAEAKRLLSPNGVIVADFFTSPLVERALGNRLTMVLNDAHLHRLIGLNGLKAKEILHYEYSPHVIRRQFELTIV